MGTLPFVVTDDPTIPSPVVVVVNAILLIAIRRIRPSEEMPSQCHHQPSPQTEEDERRG